MMEIAVDHWELSLEIEIAAAIGTVKSDYENLDALKLIAVKSDSGKKIEKDVNSHYRKISCNKEQHTGESNNDVGCELIVAIYQNHCCFHRDLVPETLGY